jgi:site-specific DNA recombinase
MIRAGLYSRVSDDRGGRSQSIDQQNQAGREAARALGWTITAEHSDPVSASRFSSAPRPGWERLVADVRSGKLGAIVLWESSRGNRRLTGWSGFLDDCRAARCLIHVVSTGATYDMANSRDWKTMADEGVSSQAESDRLSLRVRRSYASSYASGRPRGRAAWGYLRLADPVTREISQLPDPETAPIVADIIGKIAASTPISAIVADLYDRGIVSPTGQPRWCRNSIIRLVKDGLVYIAKRKGADGQLLDCNWQPLVSEDIFFAARRLLADPARKAQADRRGGVRPGSCKWMASYIARCRCGAPLNVVSRKAGPVYRCSTSGAGHASAPQPWLDGLISAAIIAWCSQAAVYEALTRVDDDAAASARGAALAERERLAGLEAQCIAGEISGSSFATIARGLEARIAEFEKVAERTGTPPSLRDLLGSADQPEGREAVIGACWAGMSLSARRTVIRVLADVTLAPSGELAADDPFRVSIRWRTG